MKTGKIGSRVTNYRKLLGMSKCGNKSQDVIKLRGLVPRRESGLETGNGQHGRKRSDHRNRTAGKATYGRPGQRGKQDRRKIGAEHENELQLNKDTPKSTAQWRILMTRKEKKIAGNMYLLGSSSKEGENDRSRREREGKEVRDRKVIK